LIFLFTDYGLEGPYLGQVETVMRTRAPGEVIINLVADAPRNNPRASAWLLASLVDRLPESCIVFCVVDPGVGTGADVPVALNIDGRWYVGPDNGLFDIVCRQASTIQQALKITWQPEVLCNSFHGRDLYAVICTMIANGDYGFGESFIWRDRHGWPDELNEVIYIDHFGNCITGMKAESLDPERVFRIDGTQIKHAGTFGEVKPVQAFWYANSNGLLEIAVNQDSAARCLNLDIGDVISLA